MDSATEVPAAPVALRERALHADPHDFAGLYIRHRSSFTQHARRYLRDQRDADEVVQEAFLRLFLALPELETELQALAYCRRTITNLCIDRFRAQARRPYLVDLDSVRVDVLADDDPGDPVVRAEDAAVVRAALSMLSPLHREALVKREIEEKPLPVIAVELAIPEDSVKHVLFRARRALRRILADSSLAPGGDGQLSGKLAAAVSKGGLGVAALLLATLGLSTGPDLHALPVVGDDLPDLPSISQIAAGIGKALRGDPASPAAPRAPVAIGRTEPGASPAQPRPIPTIPTIPVITPMSPVSLIPSPSPSLAVAVQAPATPTVGVRREPRAVGVVPAPAVAPAPAAAPAPVVPPQVAPGPAGGPGPASSGPATSPAPTGTPTRPPGTATTTAPSSATAAPQPRPAG